MRILTTTASLSLFGTVALALAVRNNDRPTATVKNGTYYGVRNPTYNQDFFLGIPYAQPPVNDLRFRTPASLNQSWSEPRNATEYQWACYGYGSDTWLLGNPVNEDCLTLNVVRPSGYDPSSDEKLPVGVWIHGGGLYQGSNRDPRYNLSFIVQESVQMNKPFIAININYRLHAFGFLYGSAIQNEGVANLGFRDQRLALHWIQENIAAFGGDPDKVTIWGESAGGTSVTVQTIAYGGRDDGLFRGAIMQSGSPIRLMSYKNATTWDAFYNNITRATNCDSAPDTLVCLRTVPIEQLNAVFDSTITASVPYWGPNIDGDFITQKSSEQLRAGHFVKVPILQGQTADEGAGFSPQGINTTEQFLALIQSRGPDLATAQSLAELYPDDPAAGIPATLTGSVPSFLGAQFKRVAAYIGDARFHAPRRFAAQIWSQYGVPNYSYVFNVLTNGLPAWVGAAHFQDVAFVFYNTNAEGYNTSITVDPFVGKPETFKQLARIMSRAWVGFIVQGDPNAGGATDVHWPAYDLQDPQNMVFDVNVTNLLQPEPDTYRAAGIQFINDHLSSAYGE